MISARVWGCGLLLVGALACGGGGDDNPTGPGTGGGGGGGSTSNAIDVNDNSFSPNATTVARGTTVTWTWRGAATHDVTFADGVESPRQSSGTFARTFGTAGTFSYQCTLHSGMTGSVVVQ